MAPFRPGSAMSKEGKLPSQCGSMVDPGSGDTRDNPSSPCHTPAHNEKRKQESIDLSPRRK